LLLKIEVVTIAIDAISAEQQFFDQAHAAPNPEIQKMIELSIVALRRCWAASGRIIAGQ